MPSIEQDALQEIETRDSPGKNEKIQTVKIFHQRLYIWLLRGYLGGPEALQSHMDIFTLQLC